MISPTSPFLRIPLAIDRKQALFLDGIRHAAQIVGFSYQRLCQSLTALSSGSANVAGGDGHAHIFLDAWAFIDAADRFRSLWVLQPTASTLPAQYSSAVVNNKLQDVRDVRNVSAHIAQKIDQILALNSSVLGAVNWQTVVNENPLEIKTHFIRPGIMVGSTKGQFSMQNGTLEFFHGSGGISIFAGIHHAGLSTAYQVIREIIQFSEVQLAHAFQAASAQGVFITDLFGTATLDTGHP